MVIRIPTFDHQKMVLSVIMVLALCLTAIASADDHGIGFELASPPPESSAMSLAATTTDLTMRPSILRLPNCRRITADQLQTLDLTVFCFSTPGGEPIPNCDIRITHRVIPFSGGHDHDDANRPKGTFTPDSGNTGPSGLLAVKYTAPEVSGIIEWTLTGVPQGGGRGATLISTIGVRIDGLEALPPAPPPEENYDLIGETSRHADNHYGTPGFNAALVDLANRYAKEFPAQKLSYNDMSLVEGGLFDIGPESNWNPPHCGHRFGTHVDLRLVPVANRKRLRDLIKESGIRTIVDEGNHWHLQQ